MLEQRPSFLPLCASSRHDLVRVLIGAATLLVGALYAPTVSIAQDVTAAQDVQLPEPTLLHQGDRAPFQGELITQEDLLRWAMRIEFLQRELVLDAQRADAVTAAKLDMERARTQAAEDRLRLHEALWTQRATLLGQEVTAARRSAERQWYESPVLWFCVGVVLTAGATIALAVAVH